MNRPWKSAPALPALQFFLCFAAGIIVSEQTAFSIPPAAIAASIASLLLLAHFHFTHPGKRIVQATGFALLLLLITGAGFFWNSRWQRSVDTGLLAYCDSKSRTEIFGRVESYPDTRRDGQSFVVRADTVFNDGRMIASNSRVLVRCSKNSYQTNDTLVPVETGDVVRASGKLVSPRPARNPGGFDYRSFLLHQGIVSVLNVTTGDSLRVLRQATTMNPLTRLIASVRKHIRQTIRTFYSGDEADVMLGLILGERGYIREEINQSFRDSGVLHILSISGTHVGMLFLILWVILGRWTPDIRIIVILVTLWFYALLTGMAPPVARAVLMTSVLLGGIWMQRLPYAVNALAVAGIIILIAEPQALFQPSFQLSFAAMLSILLLYEPILHSCERRFPNALKAPAIRRAAGLMALTFAAQIGSLPFLLEYFGQVSIISIIANLLIVPLIFLSMSACIPVLFFSFLWHFPAELFATASGAILQLTISLSSTFARIPYAVIEVREAWMVTAVCGVMLVLIVLLSGHRLPQRLGVSALCIITAVVLFRSPSLRQTGDQPLRVSFLDVGQGDATCVEFPNGETMLIDAGPMQGTGNAGKLVVLPFLRHRGISRLAALVLTHPDADHIAGAEAVLREIPVRNIYYAGVSKGDPRLRTVDSLADIVHTERIELQAGMKLVLDSAARIHVLSPQPYHLATMASNSVSVVLMLRYGHTSFLFTGDADAEAESEMTHRYKNELQADVYKVGHHGSATGSTPRFVLKVRPTYAVVSCGRLNRFNHPRNEILTRLQSLGAKIHRTDLEGAVVIESDGRQLNFVRWEK